MKTKEQLAEDYVNMAYGDAETKAIAKLAFMYGYDARELQCNQKCCSGKENYNVINKLPELGASHKTHCYLSEAQAAQLKECGMDIYNDPFYIITKKLETE